MNLASRPLSSSGLVLLVMLGVACGDSGTGGSGNSTNNNTGASSSGGNGGDGAGQTNGGNGAGQTDGGNTTTMNAMGGGGSGQGGGPTEPCPSAVTNVPTGACDLYLQNCPNGDTCEIGEADPNNPAFEPITVCIPRNGLKALGESCNFADDCQSGLTCIGEICSTFCCPEDEQSCGGGTCNVDVTLFDANNMPTEFEFKACDFGESCDFFTPDSCPPDQNCYLAGEGVATCYQPTAVQEVPEGGICDALNDCRDSSVCIQQNGMGDYLCRFLCQQGSGNQPGLGGCPVGQACNTGFMTGFAGIGVCIPDPN